MALDFAFDRALFSRYRFVNLYGRDLDLHNERGTTVHEFKCDGHASVRRQPTKPSIFGVPVMTAPEVIGLPPPEPMVVVIVDSDVAQHLRMYPREYRGSVITPCPRTHGPRDEKQPALVTRFVIVNIGIVD